MKAWTKLITAGALSALLSGTATAGTLTTPTLFQGNNQNVCIVTNMSNQPIAVTIEMVGGFSSATENCVVAPGDPFGCQEFLNDLAHCKVTAPGGTNKLRKNLRAVMLNRQTSAPFTIHAVVEAR